MMGGTSTVEVTWTAEWDTMEPEFRGVLLVRVPLGHSSTCYYIAKMDKNWLFMREGDRDGDPVDDPVLTQLLTKVYAECPSGRADFKRGKE